METNGSTTRMFWLATGIAATVLGTITSTAIVEMVSQATRVAVLESQIENIRLQLNRIEKKIERNNHEHELN